jgi:hypothetical protein
MNALDARDRDILRDLARRVAEIGHLPVQEQRRREWRRHNSLQPGRPMILIFPEGSWRELLPEESLRCGDKRARAMERDLRVRIHAHTHFDCDNVVDPLWTVAKAIRQTGWGLEERRTPSPDRLGAWHIDPVLHGAADLARLRAPEISLDEAATRRAFDEARDLFGDILTVRLSGRAHISYHLMAQYTKLRGLEEAMVDMYENPRLIHDFMAFVCDAHEKMLGQCVALDLLELNNDNTYHNSGGNGWTDELPRPGFDGRHVRPADMWASAESQELAQVGPDQHAEFALAYESRLLAPFALTGYGCCEDLTRKLDLVFQYLPAIRRISISPWADVAACAARLGRRAIFSWKPHPSHLVGGFDEDALRAYVRRTVAVCREHGCALEMILKDTHTCESRPDRFTRWSQIARAEVERTA